MRRAWLGLLAIPLVDIVVLIGLAGVIGGVATVAVVVLTGLVGLLLVRAEGRHTLRKLQEKVVRGELPTDELLDGGLLIAAGAFLLTPGVITDLLGLAAVLPPTRYLLREGAKRYVVTPALEDRTGGFVSGTVYTGGFPDDQIDLGEDAYDIGFDDDGSPDGGANENA